jgi:hypothetical protein
MEDATPSDGDNQSTPGDTDRVKEHEDDSEDRVDIHDGLDALSERIDAIRDEMIHPQAARLVLVHTGLSKAQAAELVETMQDVDRRMRDDDAV